MSHLAVCLSDSEGELPSPDLLSKRSGLSNRKIVSTRESSPAKSPSKMLVPKSASKPRRVRRLDGGGGLATNALFQKCDPEQLLGSPKKSPTKKSPPKKSPIKRKAGSLLQPSIFDDEDISPPATTRRLRLRAPKIIAARQQDSDSDDGNDSSFNVDDYLGQSLLGGNQTFVSQGSRSGSPDATVSSELTVDETVDEDQDLLDAQLAQDLFSASVIEQEQEVEDQDEDEDDTVNALDDDQSSTDETITEAESPYKETSDSEFDASDDEDVTVSNFAQSSTRTKKQASGVRVTKYQNVETSVLSPKQANVLVVPRHGQQDKALKKNTQVQVASKEPLDLADELGKLNLGMAEWSDEENKAPSKDAPSTPPETPTKPSRTKGLVSPTKRARIPQTPHRESTDAFWNAEVVNSWNDQYSPRKLDLPFRITSPVKASPTKKEKKTFDDAKQALASAFLKELDTKITDGKIEELAASTGGVKLNWSRTLNTTAGQAKWKRDTIKTKKADGTVLDVIYKHHASIELAEKVITDEDKLLNTLAHEFCHLANFMVNGITNNPHGKEFKVWAAKCSRVFSDRGIKVTTKHTYEIDFKYIWECSSCAATYKRHSKSINPSKHRCGTCKSELKQIKPVPRAASKPSEYQNFLKLNMKIVKEQNPGVPQKEIMKMVAEMWAQKSRSKPEQEEEEECKTVEDETITMEEDTQVIELTL
ncbi:unnamed protein product [Clonostachys chloroleuca]|uniref:SprT-like domain-containing protein n=1 Tax=Clonostachys chloroleuca TaxID=1926264 RepID=A0AA35Q671_9HYPO|nr:unnamed protein product [Clonostachys chloroleuca]